jgi:hypothetical protein
MCEEGYVLPHTMVVASDSHSNMYGGLGALGTPVVRTDAAAIWATGTTWWSVPPVAKGTAKYRTRLVDMLCLDPPRVATRHNDPDVLLLPMPKRLMQNRRRKEPLYWWPPFWKNCLFFLSLFGPQFLSGSSDFRSLFESCLEISILHKNAKHEEVYLEMPGRKLILPNQMPVNYFVCIKPPNGARAIMSDACGKGGYGPVL